MAPLSCFLSVQLLEVPSQFGDWQQSGEGSEHIYR